MVRTQIQLSEEQHRALRRWAHRLGISLAEAVRRCVAERLAEEHARPSHEQRAQAALQVCGKYADPKGATRVAIDHDRHLAEAFAR